MGCGLMSSDKGWLFVPDCLIDRIDEEKNLITEFDGLVGVGDAGLGC